MKEDEMIISLGFCGCGQPCLALDYIVKKLREIKANQYEYNGENFLKTYFTDFNDADDNKKWVDEFTEKVHIIWK